MPGVALTLLWAAAGSEPAARPLEGGRSSHPRPRQLGAPVPSPPTGVGPLASEGSLNLLVPGEHGLLPRSSQREPSCVPVVHCYPVHDATSPTGIRRMQNGGLPRVRRRRLGLFYRRQRHVGSIGSSPLLVLRRLIRSGREVKGSGLQFGGRCMRCVTKSGHFDQRQAHGRRKRVRFFLQQGLACLRRARFRPGGAIPVWPHRFGGLAARRARSGWG